MFPKERRKRNDAYLDFVRAHACCACLRGPPSVAHHFMEHLGGMGLKVDDHYTVPLCRICHDHWHQHRYLPCYEPENRSKPAFKLAVAKSAALMYQQEAFLLAAWMRIQAHPFDQPNDDLF